MILLWIDPTNAAATTATSAAAVATTTTTTKTTSTKKRHELNTLELAGAGALATILGVATMFPIDTIKTLQQSDEGMGLSFLGASKNIFMANGVGGFYHGLGSSSTAEGCAGGIKFSTYEILKKWMSPPRVPSEHYGTAIFVCAALSFVTASVVIVPGELIKQRLQMGHISSISNGIANIWTMDGPRGFFRGYTSVCMRDIPYTMLELGIYDNMKTFLLGRRRRGGEEEGANQFRGGGEGEEDTRLYAWEEICAAALSGGITAFLTNPLDMIKTRLMVNAKEYSGFRDCLRKTIMNKNNSGGFASLFRGSLARVTWIMPSTAIYLPAYDFLKRRLMATQKKQQQKEKQQHPHSQQPLPQRRRTTTTMVTTGIPINTVRGQGKKGKILPHATKSSLALRFSAFNFKL